MEGASGASQAVLKSPPASAETQHGIHPRVGKSPWRRHGNPPQDSCLENPMDRGVGYSPRGGKELDTTE